MIQTQTVEPGKIVTIIFRGPSSKPLEVVINNGGLFQRDNNPVYISPESPLAKAILYRKSGDRVKFQAPEGQLEVKILKIKIWITNPN